MKNRYYFFKRLYKKYVVIIESHNRYVSFGDDKYLMKYIKNNDINYIIVKSEFEVIRVKRDVNNYDRYLILYFLEENYL